MFTRLFLLISGLIISLSINAQASKAVVNIQYWQTKNSVPVYFVATPELPMVDIRVIFAAGSAADGSKPGLAQFTANMLDQGANKLNTDEIAQAFDDVGAQFGNQVDRDMAVIGLRSLINPNLFEPAFTTFLTLLTTPSFTDSSFKLIQKRTLSSIQMAQQSPMIVAKNAFYKALYNKQPYASPVIGTSESVSTLTPQDLSNFYHRYYVTKNAVIVLVGDMPRPQAEALATQIAIHLPAGSAAPTLPPAPAAKNAQENIAFPSEQTHIMLGSVGINPQSADFFPMLVGNYVLGGALLTSRLFKEVREEQGLAYNISSQFLPLAANGPFVIYLQSRNNQAAAALKITQNTLKDYLATGPTDKELAAAKQNLIGSFPLQLASNGAIVNVLTNIAFYRLPLNYLDNYRAKVQAVTSAEIRTALNKYIKMNQMLIVQVGPAAS